MAARLSRLLLLVLLLPLALPAAEEIEFDLPSGETLSLQHYSRADGPIVLLLPSVHAVPGLDEAFYERLNRDTGFDLYVGDFLGAHFLSEVSQHWDKIPESDIVAVLAELHRRDPQRPLLAMATGRGLMAALRGAQAFAESPEGAALRGVLGLSGDLNSGRPEPGKFPEPHPLIAELSVPLLMYQPERSGNYWWLDHIRAALAAGEQSHRVIVLPGVRDGFYHREDAEPLEIELSQRFPLELREPLEHLLAARRPTTE